MREALGILGAVVQREAGSRSERTAIESDGCDGRAEFVVGVDDENGVSLQRLQVLVWTVVLGCIFVNEVYAHLTMPEFSATLLTLMGISSGTYLAGKSSEVSRAAAPVPVLPLAPGDVTP